MRILVINNIQSGFGDGSIYDFLRAFGQDKDEIVIRDILHTSSVDDLLKDAHDFDLVVAAGGDNTISKVSYCLANTEIPILPYPSGTFNIITMNLCLPTETHALAKIARERKTLNFDIGEIICGKDKIGFASNAGAGYAAKISKEAKTTKRSLGPLAYIGAGITNHRPPVAKFNLTLDNKEIETEGVGILLMNFAKIGLELSVTHANRPRDGKFDVVVLKAKNAFRYIPALTAAALDNAIDFPDRSKALEIYQASSIKVDSDPVLEIQTDGSPRTFTTPFKAQVLPLATKFVVGEETLDTYNPENN